MNPFMKQSKIAMLKCKRSLFSINLSIFYDNYKY